VQLYQKYSRGGSYLEVGANIGTDTVLAAEFFKTCYLFEPASRCLELLRMNLEINGVVNCKIYPVAAGDIRGSATLYLGEDRNIGGSSLKSENPESREQENVQVVTIDDAMPREITDITYMHIDAEGHDFHILNGAAEFLSRQLQRPLIRVEFFPSALRKHGSKIEEFLAMMNRFQYVPHFMTTGSIVQLSDSILTEFFNLWQRSDGWIDIFLFPGS
jgi:FkbM family methyltransferase